MALFKNNEVDYRVLRLGCGSIHGISQAQPVIFLEELAGIPIAWQYDLVGGGSIGACAASSLVCPKEKGSLKPKISAVEYESELVRLCGETFEPYRNNYYFNMQILEGWQIGLNFAINYTRDWTKEKDEQIRNALDKGFYATRQIMRKLKLVEDKAYDRENTSRLTAKFNLCSGIAHRTIIPMMEKSIKKSREAAKQYFFSAEHIHKAFDEFMRFEDGSPVLLEDTITGFYAEAHNISINDPTEHCHIKPIGSWEGYISHPGLPLSDIPFRGIAAQTVFKPHHSPHSGHYFDDIANQNTLAAVMNLLRTKFTTAQKNRQLNCTINRHGVSIGTGMPEFKFDPEKMGEMGLLGRLDPANGAPLLNSAMVYNTTKAIRYLKEELGPEHALFVDKVVIKNQPIDTTEYKKLIEKYNAASGILRAHHVDKMGKPLEISIIDARPEKIQQLREFGWAMVWDHLDVLVNEAKLGLYRAHRHGLISARLLERRIKHIDELFPPDQMNKQDLKKSSFMDFISARINLSKVGVFSRQTQPANDQNQSCLGDDKISPTYSSHS